MGRQSTEFLPGNLTDYPYLGQAWEEAAEQAYRAHGLEGDFLFDLERDYIETLAELDAEDLAWSTHLLEAFLAPQDTISTAALLSFTEMGYRRWGTCLWELQRR